MANNWAIVIGINQYRFLQPLKYAKRDAELMSAFLQNEANFDRIFLFTDDSLPIGGKSTEPFRANLLRVLRQVFEKPFMKDGDNFWFFFSGHGIPHNGQDYLMPLDGDLEDIENTGISTNTITNYLRGCGADNAVMILDACRSGGKKAGGGIGRQTEAEARQTGVISLFSCSPDQYSYELETIGQGAFTHALLEGLGIRGRCATVERLNQYLEHRVPELVSQHLGRVRQIPYTIVEPLNRAHLILMPQHASLHDIATLKNDAYRAERNQNWDLAQRLWVRVNAATSGQDIEAIEALQNLGTQRISENSDLKGKNPQLSVKLVQRSNLLSNSINLHILPRLSTAFNRQSYFNFLILLGTGVVGVIVVSQLSGQNLLRFSSPQTQASPFNPSPVPFPNGYSNSKPNFQLETTEGHLHLNRANQLTQDGSVQGLRAGILEANKVEKDHSLYNQAQKKIRTWTQQIQYIEDRPILDRANQLAQFGDIQSLEDGILIANKIEKDRVLYDQAQQKIRTWTQQIQRIQDQPLLDWARHQAEKQDFSGAIKTARQIQPDRALYDEAQSDIKDWLIQVQRRQGGNR